MTFCYYQSPITIAITCNPNTIFIQKCSLLKDQKGSLVKNKMFPRGRLKRELDYRHYKNCSCITTNHLKTYCPKKSNISKKTYKMLRIKSICAAAQLKLQKSSPNLLTKRSIDLLSKIC